VAALNYTIIHNIHVFSVTGISKLWASGSITAPGMKPHLF